MVRKTGTVAVKRQGSNSTSQPVPKKRKVQQPPQPTKAVDDVESLKRELKQLEDQRRKMGEYLAKEERRLRRETIRHERDADHHEEELQITIRDVEAAIREMRKENQKMKLEEKEQEGLMEIIKKGREMDIADEETAFQNEETISEVYIRRINDLKQKMENTDVTEVDPIVAKNVCEKCYMEYKDVATDEKSPKVLPCGHTACLACIKELTVDGYIRCPFDRTFMKLDETSLPTNFAAL